MSMYVLTNIKQTSRSGDLRLPLAILTALVVMVTAIVLASGVALSQTAPSGTLDAHFTPDPNTLELGAPFDSGVRQAQTFTAVNSGQLTDAQVVANFPVGGELTMQITTVDSSGNPTDDVLASTTITNLPQSLSEQTVTGNFSNPASVVSGTKYALVLSAPATQGGNWFGAVGEPPNGPYAGGESMFKWDTDTVWQSNSSDSDHVDLAFAIYVAAFSDQIGDVQSSLDAIINQSNTEPALAEELVDAKASLEDAVTALGSDDRQTALQHIEQAMSVIEPAVDNGSLDADQGTQIMDDLAEVARQIAVQAIDEARARGGDPTQIQEAIDARDQGDALWDAGEFTQAVDMYKDALVTAESA